MNERNNAKPGERLGKLAVIISDSMQQQGESVRGLYRSGAISRRQSFWKRLHTGRVYVHELEELLMHLGIDLARAVTAVTESDDPRSYFDPVMETQSRLARAHLTSLREMTAALDGEFEPVRHALCESIARRNATEIAKYHAARRALEAGELDIARVEMIMDEAA